MKEHPKSGRISRESILLTVRSILSILYAASYCIKTRVFVSCFVAWGLPNDEFGECSFCHVPYFDERIYEWDWVDVTSRS